MTDSLKTIRSIDSLNVLMENADYIDSRVFSGNCSFHDFLDRMLRYKPFWLRMLYKVRSVLAKIMGLKHDEIGHAKVREKEFDFTPGGKVDFFTSVDFQGGKYWIGEAQDKHLCGYIGVVAVPCSASQTEFHTFTIVHYRNWSGPLYFNLIRPFHHLVVYFMGKYAVAGE